MIKSSSPSSSLSTYPDHYQLPSSVKVVLSKYRCDQWPDCEDGSDEEDCNMLSLASGYNKVVPPYTKDGRLNKNIRRADIGVSVTLFKIVSINERESTIDLQFEIALTWKDQRITFSNLKTKSTLNALSKYDKDSIWLPVLIYANTDQRETTRLGFVTEWSTSVEVSREGKFTR